VSKADHLPEILPRRRGIVTASEPASATHMERLMALVMTLLYRRSATVPALAGRFCVSERTIYRDLALLDAAGFPVVSSPGRGGGVGLAKGFRLERQLFSGPALGVWSQSLRALADLSDDSTLDQAADLADGLVPPEDSTTSVMELRWDHATTETAKPFLRACAQAIRLAQAIAIDYRDREGSASRRVVEPLRLVHSGGVWYLQAWCRLRGQYRLFRVLRIGSWTTLADTFDRLARLRDLPPFDPLEESPSPEPIRLALTRPSDDLLSFLGQPPASEDRNEHREIELRWPVDGWLVGWLCGQAPEVEVIAPASLREEIGRRLEAACTAYRKSPREP